MKVFELMEMLSHCPAGDEVFIGNNSNSYVTNLAHTDTDKGLVYLYGDGKYTVSEDDETTEPAAKKRK